MSSNIYETLRRPIGELSIIDRIMLLYGECDSCITPSHYSPTPHSHEITQITNQYRGQVDRGVVAETRERSNTTAVLTYERGRSVSNGYSVSIGFTDKIVSATLGYDVRYTTSETASYAMDVPAGTLASITLYDMYDVTEFEAKTTFVHRTIPVSYTYEYGDGWGKQWTNFGFSGRVW